MNSNTPYNPQDFKQFLESSLKTTLPQILTSDASSLTAFDRIRLQGIINEEIRDDRYHPYLPPTVKKIVIFGAGGTTSWFLPKLVKMLYSLKIIAEIVLVDGDIVEEKNLLRQNFAPCDVGQNKAHVLANRYGTLHRSLDISAIPKFAFYKSPILGNSATQYSDSFFDIDMLPECNCFINLVDNEGFKKQLDCYLVRTSRYYDYFSAGVNLYNGQVYQTKQGSGFYSLDHESTLHDVEEVAEISCAEEDAQAGPDQLFNGNDVAASVLANQFQRFLLNEPNFTKFVTFTTGSNMSVITQPEDLVAYCSEYFNVFRTSKRYRSTTSYFSRRSAEAAQKTANGRIHLELARIFNMIGLPVRYAPEPETNQDDNQF